jgi:hypothetical protein
MSDEKETEYAQTKYKNKAPYIIIIMTLINSMKTREVHLQDWSGNVDGTEHTGDRRIWDDNIKISHKEQNV